MKKFLYVIAAIAILVTVLFTYLGAFTTAEVTVEPSEELYVAGIPFEGSVNDEKLGQAFERAAQVLDKGELKGMLGNVYYNNPESKIESIRAFIGVIVADSTVALPADYTLRVVPARKKVVQAQANANIIFLPRKLQTAITDYAKEHNLKLEELYVEWFADQENGVMQVPVKE